MAGIDLSILNFDFETLAAKVEALEEVEAAVKLDSEQVIATLIDRAKPIVRLVAHNIPVESNQGCEYDNGAPFKYTTNYSLNGLKLYDGECHRETAKRQGTVEGFHLWLLTSGEILELNLSGTWDAWATRWTATTNILSIEELSEEYNLDVMLEKIVKNLSQAFHEAVENAESRKKRLQKQLEQLEAVKKILASA